ncbi:MAG: hypothetical protein D4R73_05525, partial [Deltaproteobacteria bacterium]
MNRAILTGLIFLTVGLPLLVIPSLHEIYILPKITFLSCLLALLISLWAIKVRLPAEARFCHTPFFWPVLLFLGLNVLSLFKAVNLSEGLYHVLWLFVYVSFFFLVVNNVSARGMQKVINWSILGGVMVSALGIGQFWGLNISFLPFPLGSTLGTKNMSAQYIILILPLSFPGFFSCQDSRKELFYGLAGATMAIFLVYTRSRGSWVGFIGASVSMFFLLLISGRFPDFKRWLQLTTKKIFILSLCLGFVISGVVAPHFIKVPGVAMPEEFAERFQSTFGCADPSARARLAMWANTLEIIKDNYLLGVGVGNWKFIYPLYSRSRMVDPAFTERMQPRDAHNDWVQMPAEIGLGAFLAFLWMIRVACKLGWSAFINSITALSAPTRYPGLAAFFLLFSLSGLLINAFFDFPFKHPAPLFYFWLFLGLIHIAGNPFMSPHPSPLPAGERDGVR